MERLEGGFWEVWIKRGQRPGERRRAVDRCTGPDGVVRGYFSGWRLNPRLHWTNPMYPSVEHLVGRADHDKVVVECRLVNDSKSILSEREFWRMIEHLYAVGRSNRKIPSTRPRIIRRAWKLGRRF